MVEIIHATPNFTFDPSENSYKIGYPCSSHTDCSPYKVTFKRGVYFLEIWGASGGNYYSTQGGKGGFTSGVTIFNKKTSLYLYIGGHADQTGTGALGSPYNGGGKSNNQNDAPGGGATDFRLKNGNWNSSLESRILVAGAGGGARGNRNGGDGGGLNGFPGQGTCKSPYGTQNSSFLENCDSNVKQYI